MSDQELPGMWETADFEGGAPDVVRDGSLRSGPVGPEKWVPEAIAEQEAYLERMRKEREKPVSVVISPDCAAAKHVFCSGDAWDFEADERADCTCSCHDRHSVAVSPVVRPADTAD